MRSLLFFLPVVVAVAACTAPGEDEDVEMGGISELTTAGNSCSLSRAKILGSVDGARRTAIERGFGWLDDNVPYSQSAQHEGYRTDCSGFVSMCWDLGESTNTGAMNGGAHNTKLSGFDELIPADALLRNGHVMMFVGWNDASHSSACVLEQSSTKNDMQFRARPVASLKKEGYKAVRAKKLAGDTTFNANPTITDDVPSTPNGPKPSKGPSSIASAGTCPPPPAVELCNAAWESDAVECGTISDGCGGFVNCDTVQTFGCLAGETCSAQHLCVPSGSTTPTTPAPTCIAKTAAEACAEAKLMAGAECGSVPNGCGGTVSCDALPGFLCKTGQTCGRANKCEGAPTSATDTATTPSGDTSTGPASADPNAGDVGDEDEDGDKDKKPSSTTTKKKKKSGGCNAAPASGGGDALPFLGLALAFGMMRRQRAKRA